MPIQHYNALTAPGATSAKQWILSLGHLEPAATLAQHARVQFPWWQHTTACIQVSKAGGFPHNGNTLSRTATRIHTLDYSTVLEPDDRGAAELPGCQGDSSYSVRVPSIISCLLHSCSLDCLHDLRFKRTFTHFESAVLSACCRSWCLQ